MRKRNKDKIRHAYCPLTKKCSQCEVKKEWKAFSKNFYNLDGLTGNCLACRAANVRKDRQKRPEYYRTREAKKQSCRKRSTVEQRRQYGKTYRTKRKDRIIARRRHKAATDPSYRVARKLRCRLHAAIRDCKGTKCDKTMVLLGCSMSQFFTHLESLWQTGMSWENHSHAGWHIDHIIPCSAFDLTKPEEQHKCFHYTNMQPLWAADNYRKNNWVPDYQI